MSDFIGLLGGRASSGSGRDKEVNALSRATLGYRVRPLAVLGHPRDPPGASPEAHGGRRKVPRDGLGARRNPRRGYRVNVRFCATAVTVARSGRLGGSQAQSACQGLWAARLTRSEPTDRELVFSFSSICYDLSVHPWASPVRTKAIVLVTKTVYHQMVCRQTYEICCTGAGEQVSSV